MANQGTPPDYQPTRVTLSGVSVWDAGGIHPDFVVLCDFTNNDIGQNTNGKHLKSRKENDGF
jgi:hypothetical protein